MLRRLLPFSLAVCLLALAGCGGSSSSGSRQTFNTTFTTSLTSVWKNLQSMNGGTVTVGLNDFTGTGTISGATVSVEILAHVFYTNGSGPFYATLLITFPDHSILALAMNGQASFDSATGVTSLTSGLASEGGTAAYSGVPVTGNTVGTRASAVGSPVNLTVNLNLPAG